MRGRSGRALFPSPAHLPLRLTENEDGALAQHLPGEARRGKKPARNLLEADKKKELGGRGKKRRFTALAQPTLPVAEVPPIRNAVAFRAANGGASAFQRLRPLA